MLVSQGPSSSSSRLVVSDRRTLFGFIGLFNEHVNKFVPVYITDGEETDLELNVL